MNDATHDMNQLTDKLHAFVAAVNAMIQEANSLSGYPFQQKVMIDSGGKRYIRLVKVEGTSSRSVYCFVDTRNGDILKAASFKAPAKHARGNIFDANPLDAVTIYGANYLK